MFKEDVIIHLKKGTSIYEIECIFLFEYGYMYRNYGDPHNNTSYNINDISDGKFNFILYGHKNNDKYISPISERKNNFSFLDVDDQIKVIKSDIFLRKHKLKKLKNKLKK